MNTAITFNQLAKIGVHVPTGTTSFHTEPGKIVCLIGSSSQFVEQPLSAHAADLLMKLYKIGGSFGWKVSKSGKA